VRRLTALAVGLALALPAFAGTTGKLTGRVTDDKKQPLPGVNIRIEGQRLGAITDDQGEYFIIGIPGGRHTVRMNLIGYAAYVAENVEITPDFSVTLNAELKSEAVQMNEVVVSAERPLLQRDATGTTRFISASDIQKLPTRGYRDAAAQQTGIVNFKRQIDTESQNGNTLIIRGGRPNETAYFVDGFSQQDPLTGTSSTAINNDAIEEVVVLTGGFGAEYGRIMSGAVNVVTREGRGKYFGSLETVTDALSGSWLGATKAGYNVYGGSVGGPVWPGQDKFTFYASAERRWQEDRNPASIAGIYEDALSAFGLREGLKPNNSSGGYTFQGKLAYQLNDKMDVKVGGLGSEEDWREYLHAYLLNRDHTPRYLDRNVSYHGTFTHTLSQRTFYSASVNFFETQRKRGDGVHFDRLSEYVRPAGNVQYDPSLPLFFQDGHVFNNYLQRRSSYYGAQAAVTSQINRHHQLKLGLDAQRHTLRFFQHYRPTNAQLGGVNGDSLLPNIQDWDGYGYDLVVRRNGAGQVTSIDLVENDDNSADGPKHPLTWSAFLQDKFEREGVIVNAGLRFDFIDVDTPALKDDLFPLGDTLADPGNIEGLLEQRDLQQNKTYARISPRLGVSFPVDDRTQLRFNYGQFYQQPNLQDLYVSYRFLEYKINEGGYFVGFGNPNLRPERTTAYEVAVARQIGDRMRLDVTAYYKDVKDLVEITTIRSNPKGFTSYRNRDFATIKGVDVGFLMRKTNHIAAAFNYSLSYANGTGSVSNTQANIAWTGSEPPKQSAPLDFDQRHKLSASLEWSLDTGEGPMWGGFRPFERLGVNLLYNVASGTPFTPTNIYNEVTLANVNSNPSGPLNSRYGPWTSTLDLKASRAFLFGATRLEAFVWALNVFDSKNPIGVYTSTGSPTSTSYDQTETGRAEIGAVANGQQLYDLAENNPNLYSNPRLVRFGVRASF
jgi:outer membrane receptor protein involved in Fe transport